MKFTSQQLAAIYRRTSGYCHLCHKKLARRNYGRPGARGAWEVEHSIPQSIGGTHHSNNLYPACCSCNRQKGCVSTRTTRRWNHKTKAPLSVERRKIAKTENTFLGAVGGGLAGLLLGGPVLGVIGALTGGSVGKSLNPDRTG